MTLFTHGTISHNKVKTIYKMSSDLPIGRAHGYYEKILLNNTTRVELKNITLISRVKNYHTILLDTKFLLNVLYESKRFRWSGNLFQATAPLYENDFLQKFVFGFGGTKLNSACLVSYP